jgi:hypothetical protein
LKIAEFIRTILNNEDVWNVIDTLTTKLVLILGRFTPERMINQAARYGWVVRQGNNNLGVARTPD